MVQSLFISGYRSYEFGAFSSKDPKVLVIKAFIKDRLVDYIENQGLEWVIISGQLGTELWAGQVVLDMQETYEDLKLAVLLPYQDFHSRWNEANQAEFQAVIAGADFVAETSKQPYQNPSQLQANQGFIIDNTDACLLIYDTEYEGQPKYVYDLVDKYQEKEPYPLELVTMFDLQDFLDAKAQQ